MSGTVPGATFFIMSSVIIKGNPGTINQIYYLLNKGINNTCIILIILKIALAVICFCIYNKRQSKGALREYHILSGRFFLFPYCHMKVFEMIWEIPGGNIR